MIDIDEAWEEYMELGEETVERTADIWDEMADDFFKRHGWTKSHMAYSTERGTGTLWVMTEYEPEVWEDTGISAREGDSLLCEGWDEAEYIGFQGWLKERGEEE
jgi:hypothetical protein